MNTSTRVTGMGSIVVSVDDAGGQAAIERAKAILTGIPDGLDKAMKAAMDKTAGKVRSNAAKAIRERYDISAANLRLAADSSRQGRARKESNVKVKYSPGNGVQATITFAGAKLPLYRFGGAYPAMPTDDIAAGRKPVMIGGKWQKVYQGVAAKGHTLNTTSPTQFESAFVARMHSGHVGIFERTGGATDRGNDEIREIMGHSVAQMVGNPQVAEKLAAEACKTFDSELDKAVYRILTSWR